MSTFVKYLPISILRAAICPLVMLAVLLSPHSALGGNDDPIKEDSTTAFRKIPARALSLLEDKTLRIQTKNISVTIPSHLQPREIREAIEYGHYALNELVDARSLVLVGNSSEDTRLMLLGGLKGGMKGSGASKGNQFWTNGEGQLCYGKGISICFPKGTSKESFINELSGKGGR